MKSPCVDSPSPTDFRDICVRDAWSAVVPAAFVVIFIILRLPKPAFLKPLTDPFKPFLPLRDADALADSDNSKSFASVPPPEERANPLWRALVFAAGAVLEALGWLTLAVFRALSPAPLAAVWPVLIALTWVYVGTRRVGATPAYDVFALYVMHLFAGALILGGIAYDKDVYGIPLPGPVALAGLIANVVVLLVLLVVMLRLPLAVPEAHVKVEEIGKSVTLEDYTSLWGFLSDFWVYPIIKKGYRTMLKESDVWALSTTIQSRPVFTAFSALKRPSLRRRVWAANSVDIIADFTLRHLSVALNFMGPFFLNRILVSIDSVSQSREERSRAYVYAVLAMIASLLRSQVDSIQYWFGHRLATRTRTELMTAVYDKALKRRDLSGSVDKSKNEDKKGRDGDQKGEGGSQKGKDANTIGKDKEDGVKSGADIGKIVNLMSGDAEKFSVMTQTIHQLYGAPFQVVITLVYLYRLLGWASLVGVAMSMTVWPLTSFLMRRGQRLFNGIAQARDKRAAAVNEMLSAIKFIKFFAWEGRWMERVLKRREDEIKSLIKAWINNVMLSAVWGLAPFVVKFVAFGFFVATGHELTIPVAFTAVALFHMLRGPLNVIPAMSVMVLEAVVSLDRIGKFLDEDEVDEQVSVLKRPSLDEHAPDQDIDRFGIEDGAFGWNSSAIEDKARNDGKGDQSGASLPSATSDLESRTDGTSSTAADAHDDHHFELRGINVDFPRGELTVVAGATASGKSALLLALLGEMTQTSGRLHMYKNPAKVDEHGFTYSISYAAQTPWLRHQSIKENILFGYAFDEQRYNDVVEACALRADFDQFEDADATEIGARGISLSGGQKARVALARAVYARTRIVLLDDPLSAVDSHTARYLFDNLFKGPLLANRTVVLVTHHVDLVLPGAYYFVKMLDGRIDTQGTVKDLQSQGVLGFVADDGKKLQKEEVPSPASDDMAQDVVDDGKDAPAKKPAKLVQEEHREEGSVKWRIYKTYLHAASWWTWIALVFVILLSEVTTVAIKFWIKIWGEAYQQPSFKGLLHPWSTEVRQTVLIASRSLSSSSSVTVQTITSLPRANDHPFFYVGIYAALSLVGTLCHVLLRVAFFTGSIRASRVLFKKLLNTVTSATFRWYDTTPQGRMLNRFGNDIRNIDMALAFSLAQVAFAFGDFVGGVVTVAAIFPQFLLPAFVISLAYREIAVRYLNTGRDLKRMESNSKSPIFSGFTELLEGIVTVRAFCAEHRFLEGLHGRIDETSKMWYTFWQINRWVVLNFDLLGAISIFITTILSLSGVVSSGLAAISITSAMSLKESVYWCCKSWASLELELNAVERVVEYFDLPQEPPAVVESCRPPAYWPSSSNESVLISVQDLEVKYAPDLPAVLRGVSFDINDKERVGLLGRTGSGKSTLAMSLLRFSEPSGGRILVDGIDISTIGVQDLRSRITFIPQDATLFSGTLRENIDPFGEYEDGECLDVLRRVHLIGPSDSNSRQASQHPSRTPTPVDVEREATDATAVVRGDSPWSVAPTVVESNSKTTITLDTQISAGGTNMSLGQRQLIAMARALLRRSTIIVLDEATSSIDFETDAKIQATIREEFHDALLLTVAHRISTVIDYDRLIVLDKGKIAEMDTPHNLIQKQGSIFRSMCIHSGMFDELDAAAKAKAASA